MLASTMPAPMSIHPAARTPLACPERLVRGPAITVLVIEMHLASACVGKNRSTGGFGPDVVVEHDATGLPAATAAAGITPGSFLDRVATRVVRPFHLSVATVLQVVVGLPSPVGRAQDFGAWHPCGDGA